MIEAIKLALEALKENHYYMIDAGLPNQSMLNKTLTAYKTLEEALAKQEQGEPATLEEIRKAMIFGIPLYTTPQPRKPLTDEQIDEIADTVANMPLVGIVNDFRTRFARAIETAHGIKE